MEPTALGTPLDWAETKLHGDTIRRRGIHQLLKLYHGNKNRQHDPLLWGDEIEYLVISQTTNVKLTTRTGEVLEQLYKNKEPNTNWTPEYGRFMLEGTPGEPYSSTVEGLLEVESNMAYRRQQASKYLQSHEKIITMSSYPLFGCENSLDFPPEEQLRYTLSQQVPDNLVYPNPRYHYIPRNIKIRQGKFRNVIIPVFQDQLTTQKEVQFDSVAVGSACCCLQVTFQAPCIDEARFIYDRLIPLAPIFQALSNNTSIVGGMLSDYDNRWSIIEQGMDDRTAGEFGSAPLQPGEQLISKSRYGIAPLYLSSDSEFKSKYNDLNTPINQDIFNQLQSEGMEANLAKHYSHLFYRDPLLIFKEKLNDEETLEGTNYFDDFQCTHWQSVRFKPPPNDQIGWRVEFRPLEVQLTDFENAAFAVVVNLLVRTILKFRPNFYMPLSLVDFNMKEAQKNDAINKGQFYFRTNIFESESKPQLMSINSIINGDKQFSGILPLIRKYLEVSQVSTEVLGKLQPYLDLIRDRANGNALTGAQYIRQFVQSHPAYQQDSCVPPTINDDLMNNIAGLRYDIASPLFGSISGKSK